MRQLILSELPSGAHIHFIGIGGISMSGLAQIMLERGFHVTGSDRAKTHITDKLEKLGAVVYEGHRAQNVSGADLVVYTAAVHNDNPEIQQAQKEGIRLADRAECLGAVMREYKNAVGVAGTHGKTTTTSMLAHALLNCALDPTISVGGELDLIGGNIRTGGNDLFITEACEYTNSFLKFFPTIALITNIEEDHLDFFKDINDIIASFRKFAMLTKDKGYVVALGSDANIKKALDNTDLNIRTYGIGDNYDYCAENISYQAGFPSFDIIKNGSLLCHINLNVPGEHNILNAAAAIAVCDLLHADISAASKGIEAFHGTHRRFERKGTLNGAVVIDDYAHHPTEIRATLTAVSRFPHRKLWCVFQPHTYSRTRTLWNDFVHAFTQVDELILADIYAAREMPDGKTTSEGLAADIAALGQRVRYVPSFGEIEQILKSEVAENDIVLTMGAGDVVKIGENIVRETGAV